MIANYWKELYILLYICTYIYLIYIVISVLNFNFSFFYFYYKRLTNIENIL